MPEDSQNKHGGARPKTRKDDARGASKGQKGQQAFVATDEQRADVEELGKVLTVPMIAAKLGINESTLRRHFKEELLRGITTPTAIIGSKVMKQAMDGCKTSQIFFLKTRGGWTQRHEVTGADGKPVVERKFDFSGMTLDEKKLLLKSLDGLLAQVAEGDDEQQAA